MLKSKKLLSMFMPLVMMVVLFAGCSGTESEIDTSKGNETPIPTDDKTTIDEEPDEWTYKMGGLVAEENVPITILTHSGHGSTLAVPSKDLPVYAYLDERLGVTISWEIIENAEYNQLVNVRLMSTDLPDMVVMLDRTAADTLVEDDFFYSYDDLDYEKNAPYAQILFEENPNYSLYEDIYRSIYDDGEIYNFGATVLPRMLFVNLLVNYPWLNKLGLEEPTTSDGVIEMLKAFRDNDPNENGKNDEIPLANTQWEVPNAFGHMFSLNFSNMWSLDDNGDIVYDYVTDKYLDYLKFRKLLYDENLIDKENRSMTENYELVAADRLGSVAYYATFQDITSAYSPYYEKGKYIFREIMPLENIYTGERQRYSRLALGTGEGMYILKESENPEVCLRIADFLWGSEEFEILYSFGIEGLSYEYDSNGKIVKLEPDDYDGSVPYLTSIGGNQPPFAYRQSEIAWRQKHPEWMIERSDDMQKYYIDGLTPLAFNAVDTQELSKYQTDVQTYIDEMTANFIEGRASLEDFNDYIEQAYEIGLTEITAIHQRRYDSLK